MRDVADRLASADRRHHVREQKARQRHRLVTRGTRRDRPQHDLRGLHRDVVVGRGVHQGVVRPAVRHAVRPRRHEQRPLARLQVPEQDVPVVVPHGPRARRPDESQQLLRDRARIERGIVPVGRAQRGLRVVRDLLPEVELLGGGERQRVRGDRHLGRADQPATARVGRTDWDVGDHHRVEVVRWVAGADLVVAEAIRSGPARSRRQRHGVGRQLAAHVLEQHRVEEGVVAAEGRRWRRAEVVARDHRGHLKRRRHAHGAEVERLIPGRGGVVEARAPAPRAAAGVAAAGQFRADPHEVTRARRGELPLLGAHQPAERVAAVLVLVDVRQGAECGHTAVAGRDGLRVVEGAELGADHPRRGWACVGRAKGNGRHLAGLVHVQHQPRRVAVLQRGQRRGDHPPRQCSPL